ncbi:MAG: cadherin domain-containing protein [Gammaproteobacteria bacterium]|nr:cadherin domain-containing protein [Gammaproteobacteria bacterium]
MTIRQTIFVTFISLFAISLPGCNKFADEPSKGNSNVVSSLIETHFVAVEGNADAFTVEIKNVSGRSFAGPVVLEVQNQKAQLSSYLLYNKDLLISPGASISSSIVINTKKEAIDHSQMDVAWRCLSSTRLDCPFSLAAGIKAKFQYRIKGHIPPYVVAPRSYPYAVTGNKSIEVLFKVQILDSLNASESIELMETSAITRVAATKVECGANQSCRVFDVANKTPVKTYELNDLGKDGDLKKGDGFYAGNIRIDASKLNDNQCLVYRSKTSYKKETIVSLPYLLCKTPFPLEMAKTNSTISNLVTTKDGVKIIADEVLVRMKGNSAVQDVSTLTQAVNARVVGSILPLDLYQFRFSSAMTLEKLQALVAQLKADPTVDGAYLNTVGELSSIPNDTDFSLQHGLTRVKANDVWDISATGTGQTVIALDTGINRVHPDFINADTTCQLIGGCASGNNDTANHGTAIAGIIAAATDNALGVAGIAPKSQIQSIVMTTDAAVDMTEMVQGFQNAASTGVGDIVNASFGQTLAPAGSDFPGINDQFDLCRAINNLVVDGMGNPIGLVVHAAGNSNSTGNHYPGRCNDSTQTAHAELTRKDLLIVVGNSVSCTTGCTNDIRYDNATEGSNFGNWLDVFAPGTNMRVLNNAGGYSDRTGTSLSSPMVAGAAAVLRSCGVPLDQIESTLVSSAPVSVAFTGGSKGRIDVHAALQSRNIAPTDVSLSATSIAENTNTTAGTVIGTLVAVDVNTCDKHTFSINGGADASFFSISGAANNQLTLTNGILNFETKPSYAVTVRVTDFFGQTFDRSLVINVINQNETPVISNQTFTINENAANGSSVGTVTAADPDGDSLNFSITAGNTGSAFAINSATGQVTVNNSAAVDFETTPTFALTVQVADAALNASATITVNLNDVAEGIPNPIIAFVNPVPFETYTDAFGGLYDRYRFEVTNRSAYPSNFFDAAPALPACGLNTNAARTWVHIYRAADNSYIYGFCALGTPNNLGQLWFAVPAGTTPPAAFYIKLIDRQTSIEYTSNTLTIP